MSKPLSQRVALVTGAAQNIGLAISQAFLKAGATVVMVDVQEDVLKRVTEPWGDQAIPMTGDLRDPGVCADLIRDAEKISGCVDILVNNAYAGRYQSLLNLEDESWASELAIGLTAMMATCRAAIPAMAKKGKGSIINLGSMNSFLPAYNMAAYATVKGGIVNFTRQIAVEYGPQGIRANALCPGYITHEKRNQVFAEKPLELDRVLSTIPLRRLGQNEDCAKAALFLASDDSSFMTGHSLVLDGGATIQNPTMVTHAFEAAVRRGEA